MDKEINIYRVRVIAYLVCAGLLIGLLLTCVWIFLWFILRFWLGWLLSLIVLYICGVVCFAVTWVKVLRYGLTDAALLINKGIWFKSRKTIPLDKITDLELVQGPLLRYFGIWTIKIQTASTASQLPEATLLGLVNPDQVREEILAAKTAFLKSS